MTQPYLRIGLGLVAGAIVLGASLGAFTYEFGHLMDKQALRRPAAGHASEPDFSEAALRKAFAGFVPDLPGEKPYVAPATTEWLLVRAKAGVTSDDGAAARVELVGRADSCEGATKPGRSEANQWFDAQEDVDLAVSDTWCVPSSSASAVVTRAQPGAWAGAPTDIAAQALEWVSPDGVRLRLVAIAAAACADAAQGCGAAVRVGIEAADGPVVLAVPQDAQRTRDASGVMGSASPLMGPGRAVPADQLALFGPAAS